MNNQCTTCSIFFETNIPHKVTCSEACRKIHLKKRQKALYFNPDTTCHICKTIFSPSRKDNIYCSIKCKNKMKRSQRNHKEKNCELCDNKFQTFDNRQRFCSISCAIKVVGKKGDDIKFKCEYCEKENIVPFHKRARRFCSNQCRLLKFPISDSEEARKKISETNKKLFRTGERIHPLLGKYHSNETKEKISKHHLESGCFVGENNPMYGILGINNPNFGLKRTTDFKENLSKIKAEQWKNGVYNIPLNSFYKSR